MRGSAGIEASSGAAWRNLVRQAHLLCWAYDADVNISPAHHGLRDLAHRRQLGPQRCGSKSSTR
jgi:hypothetical protein